MRKTREATNPFLIIEQEEPLVPSKGWAEMIRKVYPSGDCPAIYADLSIFFAVENSFHISVVYQRLIELMGHKGLNLMLKKISMFCSEYYGRSNSSISCFLSFNRFVKSLIKPLISTSNSLPIFRL